MAVAGLYALFLALRGLYPCRKSLPVVLYVLYGTSVIAYLYLETWMSHGPELLGVGLLVYMALKVEARTLDWALTGAALGLAFLMRWQNATYALLVGVLLVRRGGRGLWYGSVTAGAFLLTALPQLLFWKLTSGSWILVPQGEDFFGTGHQHIADVLFSTRHGLLVWTPLAAVGLYGLLFVRNRLLLAGLLAVFLLQLAVVSFNAQWWAGYSFGMRRLVGITPVIAFGLAALFTRTRQPRRVHAVALACTVWTVLFFVQYGGNFIPRDGELDAYQVFVQKVELPVLVLRRVAGLLW
jgi:hypothetical protein